MIIHKKTGGGASDQVCRQSQMLWPFNWLKRKSNTDLITTKWQNIEIHGYRQGNKRHL